MNIKVIGTLAALAVVGAMAMSSINTIPTKDEAVKSAWGQVENQYQRRADLIPNLVETVKGYAQHENSTLVAVTQARSAIKDMKDQGQINNTAAGVQKFEQAQQRLGVALGAVLTLQERYPELKADKQFMNLQSQLEGTENRITYARTQYVNSVRSFNTTIRTFPGSVWNSVIYKEEPKASFTAEEGSKVAPKISMTK